MRMVPDPIEVLGSTLGGSDKVRVKLDDGTGLGSLHGPLEVSNDNIPYSSLVGDSLLNPSDGSFDGSRDVLPGGALLGDPNEESGCGSNSWNLFEALIHCLGDHF